MEKQETPDRALIFVRWPVICAGRVLMSLARFIADLCAFFTAVPLIRVIYSIIEYIMWFSF